MDVIAKCYEFSLNDPISEIPGAALQILLKGGKEKFAIPSKSLGITRDYKIDYEGIENFIQYQYRNSESTGIKRWAHAFMDEKSCSTCQGNRLKKKHNTLKSTI